MGDPLAVLPHLLNKCHVSRRHRHRWPASTQHGAAPGGLGRTDGGTSRSGFVLSKKPGCSETRTWHLVCSTRRPSRSCGDQRSTSMASSRCTCAAICVCTGSTTSEGIWSTSSSRAAPVSICTRKRRTCHLDSTSFRLGSHTSSAQGVVQLVTYTWLGQAAQGGEFAAHHSTYRRIPRPWCELSLS